MAKSLESLEQQALFTWRDRMLCVYPELKFMHAIPNGGQRNIATAARLKREGVLAGVWDILFPIKCQGKSGLYIEMKYGKNKLTRAQIEFGEFVKAQGFETYVAYSWTDAASKICSFLNCKFYFKGINK